MSSLTPIKDIQAPGEASRLTENSSNMNFRFFLFWGGGVILACLDPGSDPDSVSYNTCESRSETLTKILRNPFASKSEDAQTFRLSSKFFLIISLLLGYA